MTVGAGQDDQTQFYGPVLDIAVAANATGDAAVIDSEVAEPGDAARAHAHFASDMQSTPVPPLAPSSVSAISIAAAEVETRVYYQALAERTADPAVRKRMLQLADGELVHRAKLERKYRETVGRHAPDPKPAHVELPPDIVDLDMRHALKFALERERDS